jgi:hypothetical protein
MYLLFGWKLLWGEIFQSAAGRYLNNTRCVFSKNPLQYTLFLGQRNCFCRNAAALKPER